ncbi:MAG: hypothetical protein ACXWZB_02440 [Gaiellaceae bacterium]
MADDVTPAGSEELPLVPDRRERARRTSYRFRFGLVYVILAAFLGAGVGSFVVLASRPEPKPDPAWSSWQPHGSRIAKVRQIADRIPKAYKGENGKQLTVSLVSALAVPTGTGDVPVRAVFVRPDTSKGLAEEDDIARYDGTNVVSFGLCGADSKEQCEIASGAATQERFTLLRRQAIELSLYTLKYVDDVDSVIVFMPPTPKGESNGTVFLRRSDVADELRRPLSSLLPTAAPRLGELSSLEEGQISRLTQSRTYAAQVQPSPDGSFILVLTPPNQPA